MARLPANLPVALVLVLLQLAGATGLRDDEPPAPLSGYATLQEAAAAAQALAGWSASQRRSWWRRKYYGVDERRYFARWEGNLNQTIAWNRRPHITYWQGLSPSFSLMSFPELSAKVLMQGVDPGSVRQRGAAAQALPVGGRCLPGAVIPSDWDWRSSGGDRKVPFIRPPQGQCGSCWAQATIAAVESRAMIDRVDLGPNLSEDQLLDCVNAGNGYRSRGCRGGLAEEALDYISGHFAADERAYKLTRGSGCKTNPRLKATAISLVSSPGWHRVPSSADAIQRAVYCEGPVVAYFQVDESFAFYQGGIYPAAACAAASRRQTFNHALLIVGYSFGKTPYFIVRNSWHAAGGAVLAHDAGALPGARVEQPMSAAMLSSKPWAER